jgi:hypothetical protein
LRMSIASRSLLVECVLRKRVVEHQLLKRILNGAGLRTCACFFGTRNMLALVGDKTLKKDNIQQTLMKD